ncbi:hypothetical protein [Desulfosarcina cetonica]|uniref:hypothetical protein n=1 Tax=Desulfosarcina cetonica TaxID=90730 RepID=UPI00155DCA5D|nr:hypothetical protein [Desulfosarcina cetonica]
MAGLTNGQTYWFAVTTVNTSDGEDPAVVAVSATPEADAEDPRSATLWPATRPLPTATP